MNSHLSTSLICIVQLLCFSMVLAEPDDTQQAWLSRVDIRAGWDVAERVDGTEPAHHAVGLFRTYYLAAAESVTVRVPAGERVGVYRLDGRIAAQEFEFSWSNGSGLFASLDPVPGSDEQSLVAVPPAGGVTLVRVMRKQDTEGKVELALFTSREANRLLAVSYREIQAPLSSVPKVRLDDGSQKYGYWRSDLDTPLRLEFSGAARIKIDSRLLLPDQGGPGTDSYRIYATLDGEPWRVFDLVTLLDTTAAITIEGRYRPVGRPAVAYLDIPNGQHRLELRVQRPMLVRLLARKQPDDYLYPGNRPIDYQNTVGGSTGTANPDAYFWNRSGDQSAVPRNGTSRPHSAAYLDAARIAKDNSHRLGGVGAIMPLAQWARRYPGQSQYRSIESRRRLEHTFYRDLLPQQATENSDTVFAWFLAPRLQEKPGPVYFPESYVENLAGGLASGYFTALPSAFEDAREFLLPEHFQPQQIRISVDRSELSSTDFFYIQLDDAQPVRFRVDNHRSLAATEFQPNTGAIALALLQHRHATVTATLSGAFAARHAAAPLVNAGFLELPVAESVRRVKVWRQGAGPQPFRVALAYRTSSWFQMSESGYLDLLNAAGATVVEQMLQTALSELQRRNTQTAESGFIAKQAATSSLQEMNRDLYNQWEPLLRLLYSRYASFTSGVAGPVPDSGPEALAQDQDVVPLEVEPPEIEQRVRQAEVADRAADWQAALEKWSQVQRVTDGQLQARARSRQIHALQRLGNGFLAKQLLRQDFLYARQAVLQQQALEQLIELAEQADDRETVLTLRAVAAIRDPAVTNLQQLAVSLWGTGRSRFAMYTLLAIPGDRRPTSSVLEVAYDLGWWRWFEQTLGISPDRELNALWQGYRAQLNGDYQGALDYWKEAGLSAQKRTESLADGLEIRQGLDSSDPAVRRQSVFRWEAWQQGIPGPKVWSEIPQSVTGHGGARSAYSIAQGQFADLFKATPEKPVTVSVYGPISLRFAVRPLHDSARGTPVNDWITINSNGVQSRYPIIDNRVSAGLQLATDSRRFPGQRVEILYRVPAGYHELQLSSEKKDVLVEINSLQSRFPLAVLPPLNPYTVRAVLAGGSYSHSPLADSGDHETVPVQVVGRYGEPFTIALSPFLADRPNALAEPTMGPAGAQWLRALDIDRQQSTASPDRTLRPPSLQDRLTEWLWEAEHMPDRHMAALTQAEDLAQGQLHQTGVEPVLRRLRRQASWQLVRSAQESAGVRWIDFIGWHPEAPEIRTRQAIMNLPVDNAQVISGFGTRVLSMYNLSPVELTVELTLHDAAFQPVGAMSVLVGLDDLPESTVHLSAREPATTLVKTVGSGNHVLRIRLAEPVPNQFLRIRFIERRGRTSTVASAPVQRSYRVATREQPLVLLQQGPSRLRIDEWRDGRTLVTYRTLEPGWQEVTIPVEPGREETLLRVFRRTLEPGKPVAFSNVVEDIAQPVAEPLWATVQSVQSLDRPVAEPLTADQLNGTWSLIGGWVSRRIVDDEPVVSPGAEKYITLGGAYRKFDARRYSYYYADSRLRLREQGNPTLASRGTITIRQPTWPLELDLAGSLFLQNLDASGKIESAATVRARLSRVLRIGEKSSHRPFVSLFQRSLSLGELAVEGSEKVDQDIYTRYKSDHKRGLRIGDRIQYRPWLDTVLYATAYTASNEDLNVLDPDHLGLNLGARQLIGDVDLGVRYRRFEYFRDRDRDQASTAQRFLFDLGFTRWFSSRYGLRSNLSYEYDKGSGESSIFLSLSLHRSKGRYFRDFRSGELDFLWLRQRRLLEQQANVGME